MSDYAHKLVCACCDATIEVYLGPLRHKTYGWIPLSGGWVLDERDGKKDAWCPEHGRAEAEA